MRVLLDTHFLIWLITGPAHLTQKENAVISDPAAHLLVSAVSIWELRLKWDRRNPDGTRKGSVSPDDGIDYARDNGIELISLGVGDVATTLVAPIPHFDPFDEMLLVHAQQLDARLLTRDRKLVGHPLALQL